MPRRVIFDGVQDDKSKEFSPEERMFTCSVKMAWEKYHTLSRFVQDPELHGSAKGALAQMLKI